MTATETTPSAPSSSQSPLLEANGIVAGFGANTVLHGVDLEVRRGETAAILGLNGAGKSVTMKVIGGVVPARGGEIVFDGDDVTGRSVEQRVEAGMGHVPQGRQVFPELTVEENLRLGGYTLRKRDKATYGHNLERLFDRFPRLAERRHQPAGTMSGGEQAMLAVARALIADPELILIDEPSAGLAPTIVKDVVALLQDVKRSGVTVLLVEQNVPAALAVADTIHIMQRGRIVHRAPTDELDRSELVRQLGIGRLLSKAGT